MQRIVERLHQATRDRSDLTAVAALDLSFHDVIYRTANHQRLYSIWSSMRLQMLLLIGLTNRTHTDVDPEQPAERHAIILDAIKNKDVNGAEARVLEHVLHAQRRASMILKSQPISALE
jgi:DNA-binding GntR family transcriptional regulator